METVLWHSIFEYLFSDVKNGPMPSNFFYCLGGETNRGLVLRGLDGANEVPAPHVIRKKCVYSLVETSTSEFLFDI